MLRFPTDGRLQEDGQMGRFLLTRKNLLAGAAVALAMLHSPALAQDQGAGDENFIQRSARGWDRVIRAIEALPNAPSAHEAAVNRTKGWAEINYERARRAAETCNQAELDAARAEIDRVVAYVQSRQNVLFSLFSEWPAALAVVEEYQRKARLLRLSNCPKPQPATPPPSQVGVIPSAPVTQVRDSVLTLAKGQAYGAWAEYIDAAEACDRAGMARAMAEMKDALARAEAEYARIHNGPPVTAAVYDDARNAVETISRWISISQKTKPNCPETGSGDGGALRLGDFGLTYSGDSDTWCEFGTTDPRDLPIPGGDDPRDGPGGKPGSDPRDGPGGDDPRDGPGGDDPRDGPGGDDPRDGPGGKPGGGIFIPTPPGDDPRDKPDGDDPRDLPDGDDPRDEPTVPFIMKATAEAQGTGQVAQSVGQQQVKLFAPSQQLANIQLPLDGAAKPQTDASAEPLMCTTGSDGSCRIDVPACELGQCEDGKLKGAIPASGFSIDVASAQAKSYNILVNAGTRIPEELARFVIGRQPGATRVGVEWITVLATGSSIGALQQLIGRIGSLMKVLALEENLCRTKEDAAPNDPHYRGKGGWKQAHDDQWAIKRVGFTAAPDSAWSRVGPDTRPVTVAVIDSGLDWNHADFDWGNLWKNPGEIANNGIDDDRNGYVDDVIGWDFLGKNNKPWDHDGHGTLTASIIAATSNNGVGMAGINPRARIMVLKALNAFGRSRASFVAEAIRYAANNGARVVNLSVGGPGLTGIETDAIAYARSKGVLIVVAAGNDGVNVKEQGLASNDQVMTVGATGLRDEHLSFSNWGAQVDIAAPGQDVLGLRARRTDTVRGIPKVPYTAGEAYVGADKRYYRVSGTSFSAPIVAGVASLVLGNRPDLTVDQLEAVLINSAQDIQTPGRDNFSGAGLVDARAALDLDPAFRLDAAIAGVEVVQGQGGPVVRVMGTIAADRLASARLEIGAGRDAKQFRTVATDLKAGSGALVDLGAANFAGAPVWSIRLVVRHANGTEREARFVLDVGG